MGAPGDPLDDAEDTFSGGFLFGKDEESGTERQALARHELLARLSALMRSCEGCENVAVLEVTALDAPDTSGCNWSLAVVLDPAGVAPEVYALAYASVIMEARERWNLQ
jgi:hypothetical protein